MADPIARPANQPPQLPVPAPGSANGSSATGGQGIAPGIGAGPPVATLPPVPVSEQTTALPSYLNDLPGTKPFDPGKYLLPRLSSAPEDIRLDIRGLISEQPDFVQNEVLPKAFLTLARQEINRIEEADYYRTEVIDGVKQDILQGKRVGHVWEYGYSIDRPEIGGKYHKNKCTDFVHEIAFKTGIDNPTQKDFPGFFKTTDMLLPPEGLIMHSDKYVEAGMIDVLYKMPAGAKLNKAEAQKIAADLTQAGGIQIMVWGLNNGHGHEMILENIESIEPIGDENGDWNIWFNVIEAGARIGPLEGQDEPQTRSIIPAADREVIIYKLEKAEFERIIFRYETDQDYRDIMNKTYWEAIEKQNRMSIPILGQ